MHAGTLESGADGVLASGLDDARRHAQPPGAELRIAHPVAVVSDVVAALAGLFAGPTVGAQCHQDRIDPSCVSTTIFFPAHCLARAATGRASLPYNLCYRREARCRRSVRRCGRIRSRASSRRRRSGWPSPQFQVGCVLAVRRRRRRPNRTVPPRAAEFLDRFADEATEIRAGRPPLDFPQSVQVALPPQCDHLRSPSGSIAPARIP